jgi:hypothetical protein
MLLYVIYSYMSLSVFKRLSAPYTTCIGFNALYRHILTDPALVSDDKMCIVGPHASVRSYNTDLTRLRLDGDLK